MTRPAFLAAHAAHPEWQVAVAECLQQIRQHAADAAAYTLGWCYLTDYYAASAEAILGELHRGLPGVAWVGTVGIGVSASGVEYFDEPALVLMVAPLPRTSFRLFSGRQPLPGPGAAFHAHTALVHAEGSTPEVQELLQELAERTATGYLFGGLASSRTRSLHLADEVLTGGLSGVLFGPEVDLISRVTQGCQPIGPRRMVTHAEANFVVALDHQPALDCVLADLGLAPDLPIEELGEALSATLAGISGGAEDLPAGPGQFGPDTLVRHIVGVDPKNRVLAIGDEVAPGAQLTFCTRHPDAALADVRRIATAIRGEAEGSGRAMAGALYVSCSGRGGSHFGAPHAELQAVRQALGDLPLVGFFAGGEIARDHLYGYTAVLTVFTGAPD
jgi:small ligand-binding sensory domain FIST